MLNNGIIGITNSNELGHMNLLCLVTWPPPIGCYASEKNRWEHISLISLSFLALSLSFHISRSLIGMANILSAGLQQILFQSFDREMIECNFFFLPFYHLILLISFCSNTLLSKNTLLLMKAGRWSNLAIIKEKKMHSDCWW